jgi:hypothetical protein
MANTASKTSKTSPATAACNAFAVAIIAAAKAKGEAEASFSAAMIAAIVALFAAFKDDAAAYAAACVDLLGNGLRGSKHLPGSLKQKLLDASVKDSQATAILSKLRKIAPAWATDAKLREVAAESGFAAAYAYLSPRAKPDASKPDAAATPAPDAYSPEKLHTWIAEHFDDAVIGLRQYLLRAKDAIALAKLAEIETHFAGKTGTGN